MKCTMHSSFSLSRHNWRYHINIMMRERTVWHVSITSENSYTQKRLTYCCFSIWTMMWSWTGLLCDECWDEDGSLCPTGRGSFAFKSLAMCSYDWTVQSGCPSAGAATSAPRNWPGKGPAGRCLDDLYTSPVRPPPPASSARPLYQ